MTHDEMMQKQANLLITTFPELKETTLQACNADGILWLDVNTDDAYLIKDGKAIKL